MKTRKSLLKSFYDRYHKANKTEKGELSDDFIKHNEHNRKYVTAQLNSPKLLQKSNSPSGKRKAYYGDDIVKIVKIIWEIFDGSCGQRLKYQIENELGRLLKVN